MGVSYDTATKTVRMEAVRDALDAAESAATLEVCTAGYATVLLSFTLDDPASEVIDDTLTLLGLPKTAIGLATDEAALARILDGDGTVRLSGLAVGVEVLLSAASIVTGASYSLTGGSLQHSP